MESDRDSDDGSDDSVLMARVMIPLPKEIPSSSHSHASADAEH